MCPWPCATRKTTSRRVASWSSKAARSRCRACASKKTARAPGCMSPRRSSPIWTSASPADYAGGLGQGWPLAQGYTGLLDKVFAPTLDVAHRLLTLQGTALLGLLDGGNFIVDDLGRQRQPAGGKGHGVAMQLQRIHIDIADVVAGIVVARVERLVGRTAELLRLLLALQVFSPGKQTAKGDAFLEELRIVGAEVDLGTLRRRAAQVEIGLQQTLDRSRTGWPLQAEVRTVAIIDKVAEIRRRDHVEVQVGPDLLFLLVRQLAGVVGGTDQPRLFRAPPGEPYPIERVGLAHQHCHFQQRSATRAIVVDAGTFAHRIQVCADHHQIGRKSTRL